MALTSRLAAPLDTPPLKPRKKPFGPCTSRSYDGVVTLHVPDSDLWGSTVYVRGESAGLPERARKTAPALPMLRKSMRTESSAGLAVAWTSSLYGKDR